MTPLLLPPRTLHTGQHSFPPLVFIPAVLRFKGSLLVQDTEMLIAGLRKNKSFITLSARNNCAAVATVFLFCFFFSAVFVLR